MRLTGPHTVDWGGDWSGSSGVARGTWRRGESLPDRGAPATATVAAAAQEVATAQRTAG